MSLQPTTIEEVQTAVQDQPRLLPRGGGSKSALSRPVDQVFSLDLAALTGILEYEPGEFTFTALAGTPVTEVEKALAEHGQYLPFDPLLVQQGATLGGVVATSTSGPGRYRYGGVRDFLLGVRFVDGSGRLVRGGGKVVKNSAGFDLPKLMVGSLGRLGVLTELTFKVFPRPQTYATLKVKYTRLNEAVRALRRLMTSPLEVNALDLQPTSTLWIRVGGLPEALPARLDRLRTFLSEESEADKEIDSIRDQAEEVALWRDLQEFGWVPSGWSVAKVPLTASRIPGLEKALETLEAQRRYSVGGKVAWVAWSEMDGESRQTLSTLLTELGLAGLVLLGPAGDPRLGSWPGQKLYRRVKQALDPSNRFLDL